MFLDLVSENKEDIAKHVCITGASGSIGMAIAKRFSGKDMKLSLLAFQHPERLRPLKKELEAEGSKVLILQANVAKREQLERAFDKAREAFGPVGVLINAAGIAQQKLFTSITSNDWQMMLDVHLSGPFHASQLVVPDMIRAKFGRIINISSMWGETGASMEVHYSAVKAGVIGFTKALALELGPSGITVNAITPGVIVSQMNENLGPQIMDQLAEQTPVGRLGTAEDVANAVAFMASNDASFITGATLDVNGGFVT